MTFKEMRARVRKFLRYDVWTINTESISKVKAWLISYTRVVLDTIRHINDKNVALLSVSLCYFCAMAVVPLISVCFAVTGGLGLADYLKEILLENADSSQMLVGFLLKAADNILTTAQSGLFGALSALFFIWLIIWMMDRVEKVFNVIWDVPQPKKQRKILKSYTIDLAIMILAPFIILAFTSGAIVYSQVLDLVMPRGVGFSDGIRSFLGWTIFAALAVLIIAAMYKFIPTAKVKFRYALKAALWSGVAFTLLQYVYLETQLLVTRINAVYGTVAAIPLFLLWLRFGWLIIVIGVQLSYSFQKEGEHMICAPELDVAEKDLDVVEKDVV